ncbi:MAG TPA: alpha/beta fold hydrolase [Candidatus Eisenbacteria bacterium]|nr:alpha/beta fold hydrolase [Candidatus Eisenbacteria bacterium]
MTKYVFGPFLLDVAERRLVRGDEEIRLRDKPFDTLCVLVENAGRLVRKNELMQAVWPDSIVEENNVDHCVSQLRKLLHPPKYIETVPRHGYRFIVEVDRVASGPIPVKLEPARQHADTPEQEIRFFTASDGVRIAYTIGGEGPTLVRTIDWLNHLDFEWRSPILRHWLSQIMRHNTLVRYDQRGSGLSDWNVEDFSFERTVKDFEELVEAAGLDRFAIFGGCQGAAVATAYTARHPERVTKLIFTGAFANGWPAPGDGVMEQFNALLTLIRLGWGRDNPAFRQLWSTLFHPDADSVQMDWMNELQRISTSPENAVRMMLEFPKIKVLDLLPSLTCPTLVIHSRDDAAVPVQEGRLVAARVRGARFVELLSRSHLVGPGDPAWDVFVEEFSAFLGWASESVVSERSFTA